jgi:hypothetical protein
VNRRYVLVSFLLTIVFAAVFPGAGKAQIRTSARLSQLSERPVCSEEASDPSSNTRDIRAARLSFISYLRTESECGASQRERWSLQDDVPRHALPEFSERDPIESELHQLGAAGYTIAVARQHVLAILRENNSCSAWYAQAEPDPEQKFASLRFQTDPNGEDSSFAEYDYFSLTYREPYVARAQQNVGAGSIITLNSNGAFFVSHAALKLRLNAGGPMIPQAQKYLHVGGYTGGSLYGQITTLLHEYGHIVGLLPVDRGEARSALRSTQNTETVVDHCRRQIEASTNRAVVLSLSLAMLERNGKHR